MNKSGFPNLIELGLVFALVVVFLIGLVVVVPNISTAIKNFQNQPHSEVPNN